MFIANAKKTKIINLDEVLKLSILRLKDTYNIYATFKDREASTIETYSSQALASKAMREIIEAFKKSAKFCQLPEDKGGKKS
ncbi:Uncharacterised protein [Anaerostipes hadrus]|uniref:Uncharacterized protein n=1 Tax=Anaerostipes hadrus TaxID=649756 RepID=A0A174PGK6_ANAHA|nr:hypothetical protein [Anaerostipes hadrus]CUP58956.1 Uncharacterised protein [Anaerostipes hadrus]